MSTQAAPAVQEMPLLASKLYVPPVRREQIARPRLIERLEAGLPRKLTLVSAPAGFGKTTLVAEWVQGRERVAWLSLDEGDNAPARFWRYVIAALHSTGLTMDATLAAWTAQPGDAERLLVSLINDVTAPNAGGVWLVLDDYHLIQNAAIHDGVEYLLEHLPPPGDPVAGGLHLTLVTREDPPFSLARLRGRRQLAEVRASDLRFNPREAAAFLNGVLGADLTPGEVAALERRTEGWIVGLQMAALSLHGRTALERGRFVADFAGDDRYVADYLIDEVLSWQPAHIQRFLVQTSILDRLCGPLCDAVLGTECVEPAAREALEPASPGQAILEHLFDSNLFLVSLDNQRRWFRYHRLFAELLNSRLVDSKPGQAAQNHLRASIWYESQGLGYEAIAHALQAEDVKRAADLVERYSIHAIQHGEFWQNKQWIDALPEDVVCARPLLCMARAWAIMIDAKVPDRRPLDWVERALERSAAHPRPLPEPMSGHRTDHALLKETAYVLRVGYERLTAGPARVVELCLEALETLPQEAAFSRGLVALWLAQAYADLGQDSAAGRAAAQAREFGLAAQGHLATLIVAGVEASRAWERGGLHAVARTCRETIATVVEPAEQSGERVPQACEVYIYLGRTLVEWNELEQAEPLLLHGIELAELALEWNVRVQACRDLALLHWIRREYDEAHAWMDRAVRDWRADPAYLHALRVRIWLAQAEDDPRWLDEASRWAQGRALEPSGEYDWELQTLIRVRIAQVRDRPRTRVLYLAPILALLDARLADPPTMSRGWLVQNLLLKANLLDALGRTQEARAPLLRAVEVAEQAGWMLVFVEHGPPMYALLKSLVRQGSTGYLQRILAAFEARGRAGDRRFTPPSPQAVAGAQIVEPLTEREREVLRLLPTALSGPEIADRLAISLSTFRSHTKSIYAKLDAHSRLEALSRAAQLGLLPGSDKPTKEPK